MGSPMKQGAQAAICLFVLVTLGPSAYADPFDGKWEATGPGQSMQCPGINMHFTVKGNGFGSTVGAAQFTYGFRGAIAPDGSFDTKSPGGTAHIVGKFDGDNVTVQFSNDRCPSPRQATGKRIG
jgi:hypothetical protein